VFNALDVFSGGGSNGRGTGVSATGAPAEAGGNVLLAWNGSTAVLGVPCMIGSLHRITRATREKLIGRTLSQPSWVTANCATLLVAPKARSGHHGVRGIRATIMVNHHGLVPCNT